MLKLKFRHSWVVVFVFILMVFVFKNINHKPNELFIAFSEYSDAVQAERWRQATYGLSDGYLAANMRLLFVDDKIAIDKDIDKGAKRIIGNFVGRILIVCNYSESYEFLNPDAGKLVVTAWVYLDSRSRLVRGDFYYVRVKNKWQIDKIHAHHLRDAANRVDKCAKGG